VKLFSTLLFKNGLLKPEPAGRNFASLCAGFLMVLSISIYDIFVQIFPIRSKEETNAGP
jgi:hypothetical protein